MDLKNYILSDLTESVSSGRRNSLYKNFKVQDAIDNIDTIDEFEDFLEELGYVRYPDNSSGYALSKKSDENMYFYEYRNSVNRCITVVVTHKPRNRIMREMVEKYTLWYNSKTGYMIKDKSMWEGWERNGPGSYTGQREYKDAIRCIIAWK